MKRLSAVLNGRLTGASLDSRSHRASRRSSWAVPLLTSFAEGDNALINDTEPDPEYAARLFDVLEEECKELTLIRKVAVGSTEWAQQDPDRFLVHCLTKSIPDLAKLQEGQDLMPPRLKDIGGVTTHYAYIRNNFKRDFHGTLARRLEAYDDRMMRSRTRWCKVIVYMLCGEEVSDTEDQNMGFPEMSLADRVPPKLVNVWEKLRIIGKDPGLENEVESVKQVLDTCDTTLAALQARAQGSIAKLEMLHMRPLDSESILRELRAGCPPAHRDNEYDIKAFWTSQRGRLLARAEHKLPILLESATAYKGRFATGKVDLRLVHFSVHVAYLTNDDSFIQRALDSKSDVNMYTEVKTGLNSFGIQPLHLAVDRGFIAGVKLLLQAAASIESPTMWRSKPDEGPLHHAIRSGKWNMKDFLIEMQANLTTPDAEQKTSFKLLQEAKKASEGGVVMPPVWRQQTTRQNSCAFDDNRNQKGCEEFPRWMQNLDEEGFLRNKINKLFKKPLDIQYKRKEVKTGCFIHWAASKSVDSDVFIQRALVLGADLEARAYYISFKFEATCTAMHIAASMDHVHAARALIEAKATVECMTTMDRTPHYTPLCDAVFEGHVKMVGFLLAQLANPNISNRDGRTCLHLAVRENHADIIWQLIRWSADLMAKDSNGWTPLDTTKRAKRAYTAEEIAWLAPSFHGRSSLFRDVALLARARGQVAIGLLNIAQENPEMVRRMKEEAVAMKCFGAIPENKVPSDYIAEMLMAHPLVGSRFIKQLFDVPDVQDMLHGALPVYANLGPPVWWGQTRALITDNRTDPDLREVKAESWSGWRNATVKRPLWRFSATSGYHDPSISWHYELAPRPPTDNGYSEGDSGVVVRVVSAGNLLNIKTMHSLSHVWQDEIFAEVHMQALVDCMWRKVVQSAVGMNQVMEIIILWLLVYWSLLPDNALDRRRLCWSVFTAVALREAGTIAYALRSNGALGWGVCAFLSSQGTWTNLAEMTVNFMSMVLAWCTCCSFHIDFRDGDNIQWSGNITVLRKELGGSLYERGWPRELLSIVVLTRFVKFLLLFRCDDYLGPRVISIMTSLRPLIPIFLVTVTSFVAFVCVFIVMKGAENLGDGVVNDGSLILKLYRGLILEDGDGIDAMEKVAADKDGFGKEIPYLLATVFFTIYLLNLIIAVFSNEYDKAERKSPLAFWRMRARVCCNYLLRPIWVSCKGKHSLEQYCIREEEIGNSSSSPGDPFKELLKERSHLAEAVVRLAEWIYWCKPLLWLLEAMANKRVLVWRGLQNIGCAPRPRKCSREEKLLNDQQREWDRQRFSEEESVANDMFVVVNEEDIERRNKQLREQCVHWVGELTVFWSVVAWVLLVQLPVHGICAFFISTPLALSLLVLGSLMMESEWHDLDPDRPHFVWVCYREDFDPNVYKSETIEKEHFDMLETKLAKLQKEVMVKLTSLELIARQSAGMARLAPRGRE